MTRHATDCRRAFRNYDPTCPRCDELRNGAAPRKGWGRNRLQDEAATSRAIREHDCRRSGCGVVCTAFQW